MIVSIIVYLVFLSVVWITIDWLYKNDDKF